MAQISIAAVEDLRDVMSGLDAAVASLSGACGEQIVAMVALADRAQAEVTRSLRLLEDARQQERDALRARDEAQDALLRASADFAEAEMRLARCEAVPHDEDGNSPDCHCEAIDLADADREWAACRRAADMAEQALETARDHGRAMQDRLDGAQECGGRCKALREVLQTESGVRLARCEALLDQARLRFSAAQQALDAYLAADPAAAAFFEWRNARPLGNAPMTPDQLNRRLIMTPEMHRQFMAYLVERDPAMRRLVGRHREALKDCVTEEDTLRLQVKVRRSLSGLYAEKLVEYALRPWAGSVVTQFSTVTEDGRCTKTDLIFTDLAVPVILGRGDGMCAPAGGSIAVEVKCGRARYLMGQQGHMEFQANGHRRASASVTICSRDIKDLTPAQEESLRKALRDAGSPLIGMLPRKEEIDAHCWAIVAEGTGVSEVVP